jgi:hypothetical protein
MKQRIALPLLAIALFVTAIAADSANFAGEYADKNFLKGQAVFQMSLEQNGNVVVVFFSAGHNDGSGAAPEADGKGKVSAKGTVEFTWQDSFKNSGSGTITRTGEDVVVSIKATRVADSRCLEFYGQNMRLKRVKK